MVFSSIIFIFYFLPIFLLGYYVSGWRTGALLVGSAMFYAWGEGAYLALLLTLIGLNYAGSQWISASENEQARTRILVGFTALDLAVLGFFKYAGFLAGSLNAILPGDPLPIVTTTLPLGISFFTFQLISYLVDVRRRTVPLERNVARFATYILMFPHLIAGPIVRYADIREEMQGDRRRSGRTGLGVQYFIVGLCQKVLVANLVAPLADHAFALNPGDLGMAAAWLGAWAYTLQIYFDFCGYSNMAIGLAFMLGFTFPKNFDYPYVSQSVTEFWRRWHMSLSSWFRDYVYIPLGGNRHGQARTIRNLLTVFFLTGLWHGAAWQFIVWGLYHGFFLMLERFGFSRIVASAPRALRHAYLLLVVMVGWVFFRAENLTQAMDFLGSLFGLAPSSPDVALAILLDSQAVAALIAGSVLAVPVLPWLLTRLRTQCAEENVAAVPDRLDTRSVHVLPIPLMVAGLVLSVAYLAGSTLNPFLYFRF